MVIHIWKIYSYWVFLMTFLWCLGYLPFSPLASAIVSFIGASLIPISVKSLTQANIFIVLTHAIPLWILRRTSIDVLPNLSVFLVYNALLHAYGTSYREVYTDIFTHQPLTVRQYLAQRGLV